jgi:hypothetical protein
MMTRRTFCKAFIIGVMAGLMSGSDDDEEDEPPTEA